MFLDLSRKLQAKYWPFASLNTLVYAVSHLHLHSLFRSSFGLAFSGYVSLARSHNLLPCFLPAFLLLLTSSLLAKLIPLVSVLLSGSLLSPSWLEPASNHFSFSSKTFVPGTGPTSFRNQFIRHLYPFSKQIPCFGSCSSFLLIQSLH